MPNTPDVNRKGRLTDGISRLINGATERKTTLVVVAHELEEGPNAEVDLFDAIHDFQNLSQKHPWPVPRV